MVRVIDYCRESVKITNTEQLPRGSGARLLLAIESPYPGEYAAARWLRKMPQTVKRCYVVIRF
jgi:hypothetical protein